jgi:hypothetical protein
MTLALQIGIFTTIVISVVSIFMVPTIYFWFMKNVNLNNSERIVYNIVFVVLITILGIVLYFNGKKNDPKAQPLAGFIVILFLLLSGAGIRMDYTSINAIGLSLDTFSLSNGLTRIAKKWYLNKFSIFVFMILLFVFLCLINFIGVKKKKLPNLKNKSASYLKNLSKLIWVFGMIYGFIFASILLFFNTQIEE